jgi:hypothetical protein
MMFFCQTAKGVPDKIVPNLYRILQAGEVMLPQVVNSYGCTASCDNPTFSTSSSTLPVNSIDTP